MVSCSAPVRRLLSDTVDDRHPLSANAYPAALGLSLITGGRSRVGMWGPSSLALRARLFGIINAARPRSPLSPEQG